ncbi:ATP-binding protein [Candidatus Neptunochlamydia vexilliferae]|nr:ATP-binding protein [Candidatus Neptunochlamydia vexilliferae]
MKKLPIGIQNIREIIEENYIYVDKTRFAHQLISSGKHYFLARPRRFGKSLFLNTLEEIFKGSKELFQGCYIEQSNYDWKEYPVVYLDFSQFDNSSSEQLKKDLAEKLEETAQVHQLTIKAPSIQSKLRKLIEGLAKKERVVVLVDDYDKPIIDHLKNVEQAIENRDLLQRFFATLKSLDRYLKFIFTTGVSKFSQVSLFSAQNNLNDITMDPRYGAMMGYTVEELALNFEAHIDAIAKEENRKKEEIFAALKIWYNGYRFTKEKTPVYNPFSTLKYMDKKELEPYWYSTGTPSFLIHQVQKHPQSMVPLIGTTATKNELSNINDFDKIHLPALMFQTGYLTIDTYNPTTNRYHLTFPNKEVQEAFLNSLVKYFTTINPTVSSKCQQILETHQLTLFFNEIRSMLASFPYQLFVKATEATYQSVLLGILKGMELEVEAEQATNIGRSDLVIQMEKTTYILELKLNAPPEQALAQIHDRKYFERYTQKGKEIALIGVTFSSESRTISSWKGELLSTDGDRVQPLE